jgi:hypothetical protein
MKVITEMKSAILYFTYNCISLRIMLYGCNYAITALTNDGLSKRDIDTAFDTAKQRAEAILENCERQETRIKGVISVEYDEMMAGYFDACGL